MYSTYIHSHQPQLIILELFLFYVKKKSLLFPFLICSTKLHTISTRPFHDAGMRGWNKIVEYCCILLVIIINLFHHLSCPSSSTISLSHLHLHPTSLKMALHAKGIIEVYYKESEQKAPSHVRYV